MNTLNGILEKSNPSIDVDKYEHPNGTLTTTFQKPTGKKIRISDLNTAHRQFENTPKEKFQDQ